jgi:hypothetical protein
MAEILSFLALQDINAVRKLQGDLTRNVDASLIQYCWVEYDKQRQKRLTWSNMY